MLPYGRFGPLAAADAQRAVRRAFPDKFGARFPAPTPVQRDRQDRFGRCRSRARFGIATTSSTSPSILAWVAIASPAIPIICALAEAGCLAARLVTSSQFPCVAATTARSAAAATRQHRGGRQLAC